MKLGALIGAGYFAQYHLDAWERLADVQIVAIADIDSSAIDRLDPDGTMAHAGDAIAMMDAHELDFVDIVTPPHTHKELVRAAAERGIHIICQKPLAPTHEEAVALVDETSATSVRFMVHENWRWQPWYRTVKAFFDAGSAGTPFNATFTLRTGDGWQPDAYLDRQPYFRDYPRLLMFESGVHLIDTFRYLFGEVESVYAQLRHRNPEIVGEDAGVCVFTFASGAVATLDASRYNESTADDPRYTFGTMRIDSSRGHLELGHDGDVSWKPLGQPAQPLLINPPRQGFAGDCVANVQRHFLDSLASDRPFESSGEDYLKTIAVVEACYESAESGQAIRLS